MKKIFLPFLILFLLPFFTIQSEAQIVETNAGIPGGGLPTDPFCDIGGGVSIYPCTVSENDPTVQIRFSDLPEDDDNEFYFCRFSDQARCDDEDDFNRAPSPELGFIQTTVCGDHDDKLKGDFNDKPCRTTGEDWFHQGKVYTLGLYYDDDKDTLITYASFYIGHYYPNVSVSPQSPSNNTPITVTLSGRGRGDDKQNNYQIELKGRQSDFYAKKCVTVEGQGGSGTGSVTLGPTQKDGAHLITIRERVNEKNECDGGFTYYHIPVKIGCESSEDCVGEPIRDPNNQESREANEQAPEPTPICTEFDADGRCISVNTALGKIGVSPETFVGDIFRLLLSFAGIIATVLFLIAGYRLISSRGDKEMIQNSREQIVAVVLGILFIILSFVLLEAIGVDVLRLPGFGR